MAAKLKIKWYSYKAKMCKYNLNVRGYEKCEGEFCKDVLFDDEYKLNNKCRYCSAYAGE